MKQLKINNSSEIKQILDKAKDISIAEEIGILSYIYALENNIMDLKEEINNPRVNIEFDLLEKIKADLDGDVEMR